MCWICRGEGENVVSSEEDMEAYNRERRAGRSWRDVRREQAAECEERRASEQKKAILKDVKSRGKPNKKRKM